VNKVQIGSLQLITIFANLVYGKAVGYTNGTIVRVVGNDAWLSMAAAFLTGALIMPAMVWLTRRRGSESPMEYIPKLLGRPLGSLVMLLMGIWFIGAYITSSITITQHINDYLMTETPLILFVVGYTALTAYGAWLGVEVVARLSVLGLVMAALLNLAMALGSISHVDPTRLLPFFDHGVLPVIAASARGDTDVAMATASALILLPLCSASAQRWLRICWWGLGTGGVLVLIWTIFEITVLGPEMTAQYLIACMQMARAAELSIYLHRYEMIMVVMFVYAVVTQSVICLYCAVGLTGGALRVKVGRGYLIGAVALLAMGPQYYLALDRDHYGAFLSVVWPPISIALAYATPLFLCLVALFRPAPKKATISNV